MKTSVGENLSCECSGGGRERSIVHIAFGVWDSLGSKIDWMLLTINLLDDIVFQILFFLLF